MSPVTHFFTGWVLANCANLERRDRSRVTLACVIPDVDGLGIVTQVLTANSAHPLMWFTLYHHSCSYCTIFGPFGSSTGASLCLGRVRVRHFYIKNRKSNSRLSLFIPGTAGTLTPHCRTRERLRASSCFRGDARLFRR